MANGIKKWIFWLSICTFLNGCLVGPDFHSPAPPQTQRFTENSLPEKTVSAPSPGGAAQALNAGQDVSAEWWALFHSSALNELIERGIANSPTLAAAQAALNQAIENLRAGEGAMFPTVNENFSAYRIRASGINFGSPELASNTFNVFNVITNLSYTLDVFGGIRRQIEELGAQVDFQSYQWQAAYLTLTASIVTTAILEASLREQIAATNALIHEQEQILHILQQQFKLGGISQIDVLTQQTQVAQTRATLPPLQKNLAQARDALAVLVGCLPSESNLPRFHLAQLRLPQQLPVSVPSALVRQRPDVQAADALLHAASAQIGVATANIFPQVTLSADWGWTATSLDTLFTPATLTWDYGTNILQPIFHGGTLLAQRRAAIAAYQQSLAQYGQTVLKAFQNVADVLQALQADAKALSAQAEAENSARANLTLAEAQFKLGAASYLTLLIAERQYHQTVINRIIAEANRYSDTAALFQALGGGWWNRTL